MYQDILQTNPIVICRTFTDWQFFHCGAAELQLTEQQLIRRHCGQLSSLHGGKAWERSRRVKAHEESRGVALPRYRGEGSVAGISVSLQHSCLHFTPQQVVFFFVVFCRVSLVHTKPRSVIVERVQKAFCSCALVTDGRFSKVSDCINFNGFCLALPKSF